MHRRFLELVKVAVDNGHYIQTCTNFSKPLDFWDKFVSMAKDRLCKLQISYHPTQIKDKDEFISKIKNITKALSKNTEFILSAVLSDENYDDIIRLQKELKGTAIELELQHLRELDGSYVKYSPKLQNLLESCAKVEGLDKVSNNKSFGILCSTGKNFFTIGITGDIGRCYRMNDLYHLGNITEKLYLYKTKLPCIAKQCNCTLPYTHGCLDFSHKMPLFAKFLLKFAKYNFIKRLLQKKVALNDFTKGQK